MDKKKDFVREEIKQRVLLFDLETSFNVGFCFGKWEQNINRYLKEVRLLSFAYKWLGEDHIYCFAECDFKNNEGLVKELWETINKADILVAHHGKKFDVRMMNTFFIEDGLAPTKPYKVFDTREFAKYKFGFNSNSLDDLGEHLGFGKKERILDKDMLWERLTMGTASNKDWAILKKYNKKDVILLEKVYLLFKPYTTNHPPIHINDRGVCPMCGSDKLIHQGWKLLANGLKRKQYACKACGKWSYSNWTVRFADQEGLIK
jgi:hypothetical protein